MAPPSLLLTTPLSYLASCQIHEVAFRDLGRMAEDHTGLCGDDRAVTENLASETYTENLIRGRLSHKNTTEITPGLHKVGSVESHGVCPVDSRL